MYAPSLLLHSQERKERAPFPCARTRPGSAPSLSHSLSLCLSLSLSLFLCPSSSITLNECRKHWLVRCAFAVVAATHLPASFSHNTVHTTSRQHSDFTLNLSQPKRARKKRAGSVASASKTSRRSCMCQGNSCISTGTMDAYRAWVLFPLLFPGKQVCPRVRCCHAYCCCHYRLFPKRCVETN